MNIWTVASSLGIGAVLSEACKVLLQGSTSPIAVMFIVFAIVFFLGIFVIMVPYWYFIGLF